MTKTVKQTCSEHSHLGGKICGNHMLACVCTPLPVMKEENIILLEEQNQHWSQKPRKVIQAEEIHLSLSLRASRPTYLLSEWLPTEQGCFITSASTHTPLTHVTTSEGRYRPVKCYLRWNATPRKARVPPVTSTRIHPALLPESYLKHKRKKPESDLLTFKFLSLLL